jgi:hypothetical protein
MLGAMNGPAGARVEDRRGLCLAAGWAAAAAAALVALYLRHRHTSLDGDFQGWASASCMLMARAFNQLGAAHMHFVPVQNNLPVGNDPDVYLHWPPLYPLVLAFFLRIFGDDVGSGRMLALLITLLSGGVVALIAKRLYSLRTGLLAAFFFFTVRATYEGASPLLQQPLAMLFALCAVLCFLYGTGIGAGEASNGSRWFALAGAACVAFSIGSAWDPVFVPFSLLVTGLWLRERKAMALAGAYCAVAVLTFVAVEADYLLAYPQLFANQFATILYRAGMHFNTSSSIRLHTFVDAAHFEEQYGLIASYWRALRNVVMYFSSITLVASALLAAMWVRGSVRQRSAETWLIGSLLLPVVVWCAIMRNYVAIHPFSLVLAAPFAAIASGVVLDRLWSWFAARSEERPIWWALAVALPVVVLLPLLMQYRDSAVVSNAEFTDLSPLIRDNTPADAVVLTPAESLVPTYYSRRHLVRGIETDATLREALVLAHQDFPGSPLFFAVRDLDRSGVAQSLAALPPGIRRGDSVLYRLP